MNSSMEDINNSFEQRADYLDENDLVDLTAENEHSKKVENILLRKQTALIVGPRGCGKTHMMRFVAAKCKNNPKLPAAFYVTFNRYFWLEPMLASKADAISVFHSWVLARILLALLESYDDQDNVEDLFDLIDVKTLKSLIAKIERNLTLSDQEEELSGKLTIYLVLDLISYRQIELNRDRTVLLLDDAALTLTPEYMKEFFEMFRVLKSSTISPKASVYPGTTEYSPRFHPTQEGILHPVWLSVEDSKYLQDMDSIASKRTQDHEAIPIAVKEYLKFASFGIPRAYLTMLESFKNKEFSTTQQGINKLVQRNIEDRLAEFKTISIKSPKLKGLIDSGESLFLDIVSLLTHYNQENISKGEKQIKIGLSKIEDKPYVMRMLNLLVEAGLLFEVEETVSHGKGREYHRYIPHLSALLNNKAFLEGDKGWSAKEVAEKMKLPSKKQPVRRSITSLISQEKINSLGLDLPKCSVCGEERININQKFCHNCGAELVDGSIFESCMSLPLHKVPGLTAWTREKLKSESINFKTIGDLLASQDPGTELRRIHRVGEVRAERITNSVAAYVDEFLQ